MEILPHTPPRPSADTHSRISLKVLIGIGVVLGGVTIVVFWFLVVVAFQGLGGQTYSDDASCKIGMIPLHGTLVTYSEALPGEQNTYLASSENIVQAIESAEQNPSIQALVLDVDSYGGIPVAASEIAHALQSATKPTVALIRGAGLSASYWASTGAETIFASPSSDVGSIGVTMSYVDDTEKNARDGVHYNELASGKFKNTGDPNRPLSEEERELMMRDIQIVHQQFIEQVSQRRHLSRASVEAIADGSSVIGVTAINLGLVDRLGDLADVREFLKLKIGQSELPLCVQNEFGNWILR